MKWPSREANRSKEMSGFHIGNHRAGDGSRDWDGYIDDVAVYDLELTPTQIRALVAGRENGQVVHAGNLLQQVPQLEHQKVIHGRPISNHPCPCGNGECSPGASGGPCER